MGKIESLTEEQEAKLPEYAAKWIAIGKDVSALNKEAIKIHMIGYLSGHKLNDYFWCGSPMSIMIVALLLNHDSFVDMPDGCTPKKPIDKVAMRNAIFDEDNNQKISWKELDALALEHYTIHQLNWYVEEDINKCNFGQQDAAWLSFYHVMKSLLGVKLDPRIDDMFALAEHSNWIKATGNIAFCSEKPVYITATDDLGRAHCETGPYILYPDGWSTYCWHGTQIPRYFIENKEQLTPGVALTLPNMEQRRAACEILGWDKILTELNARVINEDGDPEIGKLLEVDLPDLGTERFLQVQCGTGRTFALPVPPEMETALQAQSWTWGMDEVNFFKPEVRT